MVFGSLTPHDALAPRKWVTGLAREPDIPPRHDAPGARGTTHATPLRGVRSHEDGRVGCRQGRETAPHPVTAQPGWEGTMIITERILKAVAASLSVAIWRTWLARERASLGVLPHAAGQQETHVARQRKRELWEARDRSGDA